VYATARNSGAVVTFRRDRSSGALRQLGCVSEAPIPGCATGTALTGADVVVASKDGDNVYVGAFFGNAIAAFSRSADDGDLTQLAGGAACIAEATTGCTPGIALKQVEGLAISDNGESVYAGTAESGAVVVLDRDPARRPDPAGSGCVTDTPLTGCVTGSSGGINAVALDGKDLYATSLFSASLTSFSRSSTGHHAEDGLGGVLSEPGPLASSTCYVRLCPSRRGLVVAPGGHIGVTATRPGPSRSTTRPEIRGGPAEAGAAGCRRTGWLHEGQSAGRREFRRREPRRFVYVTAQQQRRGGSGAVRSAAPIREGRSGDDPRRPERRTTHDRTREIRHGRAAQRRRDRGPRSTRVLGTDGPDGRSRRHGWGHCR
jgi:hypothetical protein